MEPLSLSAGLIGLATLFSTSIEGFEYLNAARSLGRDYELLLTQFDVEKTRLLIWGESMGLLQEDEQKISDKLTSPLFRPVIDRSLNCIKMLLTDTQGLKSRYGLKESLSDEDLHRAEPSVGSVSLSKFHASYRSFCARTRELQHDTTMLKKVRWAIHDRAKFGCFIGDLRQCINGLWAITDSPATVQTRARLIKEEVRSIKSATILSLLADSTVDYDHDWSEATSEILEASELGEDDKQRISDWVEDQKKQQGSTSTDLKSHACKDEPRPSTSGLVSRDSTSYTTYFVPGYMISRQVMFNNVHYFLGPQATVRPFTYQQREGYLIQNTGGPPTKVRAVCLASLLNNPFLFECQSQIEDLQYLSQQYEQQAAARMIRRSDMPDSADIYLNKSVPVQQNRLKRDKQVAT